MNELKRVSRTYAETPARWLGRLGLTPNALTVIGSLLTASVGVLIAQGWFVAAGVCLWLFSATDTLDGALARATGRVTVFGAFLDSVSDRYAEAAVFFGIAWYYQATVNPRGVALTYLALVGSLMVSYARARADLTLNTTGLPQGSLVCLKENATTLVACAVIDPFTGVAAFPHLALTSISLLPGSTFSIVQGLAGATIASATLP